MPEDDPGEDGRDRGVVEVVDVDRVEVSHEPAAHLVIVSLRWSDGSDHPGVHNLHAEQLLVVVPDLVVHHLPEQLNGTLAANRVHGRQVDVVDEDDELFAKWGTIHSFPPLVQLAHDNVLRQRIWENVKSEKITWTVLGVVILVKKRAVDANFSLSSFLFNISWMGEGGWSISKTTLTNLDVDGLAGA